MELIPDDIDLSAYTDEPDFRAQVRSAADFAELVKADLDPHAPSDTAPGLMLHKARGLLHFRPGEVTVWSGYNGHRKSMFTSQAMIDLAAQGERVLIVSLEMLPWRTMSRMTRQACGIARRMEPHAGPDRLRVWSTDRWLGARTAQGESDPDRAGDR